MTHAFFRLDQLGKIQGRKTDFRNCRYREGDGSDKSGIMGGWK